MIKSESTKYALRKLFFSFSLKNESQLNHHAVR